MTLDSHLEEAIQDARRDNAQRINWLRAAGAIAFTITMAMAGYVFGEADWLSTLLPTAGYCAVAIAVLLAGRASPRALRASRFAVPAFDMPAVFTIQLIAIAAAPVPGHVSEFSTGLYVCLLMLSAFTLNPVQLYISLGLAILLEQLLQGAAGIGAGGRIASTVVLCFAAWMGLFVGRTQIRLVERVTQVNARRLRLQRYFSPGVGEILEEQDEDKLALGQERELTVLFVDLRGFTALSEALETREVIALLNTFHATMVEEVFRHGGTLDKYLGDGLMAYFNAPVGQPDHAARAVNCALAMEQALITLNQGREERGEAAMEMGIGIHTGDAIVGDVGAPHRREFTAIGSAVNIASRLEGITKEAGVAVLASEATANLVDEEADWREVGKFPVRGCPLPLLLLTPEARQ